MQNLDNERALIDLPEDYEPKVIIVPGAKFTSHGKFKTPSGKPKGAVVHYTVSGNTPASAKGVVNYLASKGLGCLVMDGNGDFYAPAGYDFLNQVVYHAGQSSWKGVTGISDENIGIEICCWGLGSKVGPYREVHNNANQHAGKYQAYTAAQEQSLINFCLWLKKKCPDFSLDWVVGHDEIAPTRKQDPGGSLSMTMPAFRDMLKGAKPQPVPVMPHPQEPKNNPIDPKHIVYGDTVAFTKAFQKKMKLKDDGVPGPLTYGALNDIR